MLTSVEGVFRDGKVDENFARELADAIGTERILFAVDYPYQRNEDAVRFIDSVTLSDRDRALICHENAERVLKL